MSSQFEATPGMLRFLSDILLHLNNAALAPYMGDSSVSAEIVEFCRSGIADAEKHLSDEDRRALVVGSGSGHECVYLQGVFQKLIVAAHKAERAAAATMST